MENGHVSSYAAHNKCWTSCRGEATQGGGVSAVSQKIASLDKSVRRRELREVIGQELKAHCDTAEPMPERLAELLKQLARRIDEPESGSGEV